MRKSIVQMDSTVGYIHGHGKYLEVRDIADMAGLPHNRILDGGVHLLFERVENEQARSLFLKLTEDIKPMNGNTVYVHIGELAEYFNISTDAVYKRYRCLKAGDVIRRVKKGHYKLSPYIVFSGSTADWKYAMRQWEERVVE